MKFRDSEIQLEIKPNRLLNCPGFYRKPFARNNLLLTAADWRIWRALMRRRVKIHYKEPVCFI